MGNVACSPKKDRTEEPNANLAMEGGLQRNAKALTSPPRAKPERVKARASPLDNCSAVVLPLYDCVGAFLPGSGELRSGVGVRSGSEEAKSSRQGVLPCFAPALCSLRLSRSDAAPIC